MSFFLNATLGLERKYRENARADIRLVKDLKAKLNALLIVQYESLSQRYAKLDQIHHEGRECSRTLNGTPKEVPKAEITGRAFERMLRWSKALIPV